MDQPACRTLALEYLPRQRCLVMYAGTEPPTDAAWDMYLDQLRVPREIRIFVVTEGSRPTKAQQARLADVVNIHPAPTAVISPAVAVRFVVSSVALFKSNLRYFTPDQVDDAYQHLGIRPVERVQVEQALERLRKHMRSMS